MMQARILTVALAALFGMSALSSLSAQDENKKLGPNDVQTLAPGDRNTLLTLRLKDRLLKDVIATIRRKVGVNIIMDDEIDETVSIDLEDVHWRTALNLVVEKAGCVMIDQGRNLLKVEKPPRVYFSFQNAPIQQVIDTIAKISGANIVVAPEVQGPISLRLRNIPWRDALDAAVKTLGYAVVEEKRGILRVVPRSNLREDLVTKSFQLRYVRPQSTYRPIINSPYVRNTKRITTVANPEFELVVALRRVLTPNLGTLEYFGGSNILVVKDIKPVIDEIEAIINQIDTEPAQIFIDVRFVTTSNRDILEYGIDVGDGGWVASVGGGQIPTRLPFNLGSGGFEDSLIADDRGSGPFAQGGNAGTTSIPNVIFGALNFQQVTAALRLLKQDVHSEIMQAPKLVALDHQEATIFVGETVRYAQARAEQGQAGGLQLVVEEAPQSPVSVGFQLLVVPHIVPGTDKIIMDVIPQSDALSGTGSSALAPAGFDVFTVGSGSGDGQIALPRVSSSTIATQVLLRSGQTAVLGGLMTDTLSETVTQLPLLGDIPLLGWLFKHKNTSKTRTSLIVFVTPQLIRSPEEVDESIRRMMREREEMVEAERRAIFGEGRPTPAK